MSVRRRSPSRRGGRPWWRRHRRAVEAALVGTVSALVSGLLVALLTAGAGWLAQPGEPFDAVITVNMVDSMDACHPYIIRRDPAAMPSFPADPDARPRWWRELGGVDAGVTNVDIALQGTSATTVQITHVRPVVTRRTPAPGQGKVYQEHGCGGEKTARYFDVDLDQPRPQAVAMPGHDLDGLGKAIVMPAIRLNYTLSSTDVEFFIVRARTAHCDCSWHLELDWVSGGERGTKVIDVNDQEFRTQGAEGLPHYIPDTGTWKPKPPPET